MGHNSYYEQEVNLHARTNVNIAIALCTHVYRLFFLKTCITQPTLYVDIT